LNNDRIPRILFLCSGNSCRSQMAEGFTRARHATTIEALSAGINPGRLDPLAVQVMAEAGIDISNYRSKSLEELRDIEFDLVVTVCSEADAACPVLPGTHRRHHQPLDDPPRLAATVNDIEEKLRHYRRVRDEIGEFVERLPGLLSKR